MQNAIIVTSNPTFISISINGRRAYRAPSFDYFHFRGRFPTATIIINGVVQSD